MNHHMGRLERVTRRVRAILCLAVKKDLLIDGAQWAGAFAFNAFFSLFLLIVLFVTIALAFIDRDRAGCCGCIFVFGACLCAAQSEKLSTPMENHDGVLNKEN